MCEELIEMERQLLAANNEMKLKPGKNYPWITFDLVGEAWVMEEFAWERISFLSVMFDRCRSWMAPLKTFLVGCLCFVRMRGLLNNK